MYVYICVCVRMYTCKCMGVGGVAGHECGAALDICIVYLCTHVYTCVHIHKYVYIYIYIYEREGNGVRVCCVFWPFMVWRDSCVGGLAHLLSILALDVSCVYGVWVSPV